MKRMVSAMAAVAVAAMMLLTVVPVTDGDVRADPGSATSTTRTTRHRTPSTSRRTSPAWERGEDLAADSYTLQIGWQGGWYDVNSTTVGFESFIKTSEGFESADTVVPEFGQDFDVWFMVTGLDSASHTEYEFRLMAERTEGVQTFINPSIPVTAYLDSRVQSGNTYVVDGYDLGSSVVIPSENLRGEAPVMVKTALTDRADVWMEHRGALVLLAAGAFVTSDGYLVFEYTPGDSPEDPEDGGSSPLIVVGAVTLAMIVTAFAVRTRD